MNSITYFRKNECVADFRYIEKTIIRDKVPVKKQGLTDYYIEIFEWYGRIEIIAYMDTTWIGCYLIQKHCTSLREASDFIKSYIEKT